MYAVIQSGNKQYRVAVGDRIQVDRLVGEVDSSTTLDQVLFVGGEAAKVGAPLVPGATVTAKVVSHDRGDKVITFKMRRRHRFRKTVGFRSSLTTLEITAITA